MAKKIALELETIIGLEIHVQLKTKSKMFCRCDNTGEDQPPNSTICSICTGQPGTLPVVNDAAVRWGIKAALALNCQVAKQTKFDRKNYFYPDLPKGYQISQYDVPLASNGVYTMKIDGQETTIGIERVHLEEDSAKLVHPPVLKYRMVYFNRSVTPLLYIVTRPDFRTPTVARVFLQELRLLMRYLDISGADMEKGHLRCDANISLRPNGDLKFYPKTEIKNLNSFKAVEKALIYEQKRQTALWQEGQPPDHQTTRGWNDKDGVTIEQRGKEEESDYRYFPEPDIPPLELARDIEVIQSEMPELPAQRYARYKEHFKLTDADTEYVISNKELADYFEAVVSELKAWFVAEKPKERGREFLENRQEIIRLAAGWLINKLSKLVIDAKGSFGDIKITAENFAEFIKLIYSGEIGSRGAQEVLKEMFETGRDPSEIVVEKDLKQLGTLQDLELAIDKVITENPKPVEQYRKGKIETLQFLIGLVMKETRGRANPAIVNDMLVHKLR